MHAAIMTLRYCGVHRGRDLVTLEHNLNFHLHIHLVSSLGGWQLLSISQ